MKYRVVLSVTIDVEANDETHAEVQALEYFDLPGLDVVSIEPLDDVDQPGLFDE